MAIYSYICAGRASDELPRYQVWCLVEAMHWTVYAVRANMCAVPILRQIPQLYRTVCLIAAPRLGHSTNVTVQLIRKKMNRLTRGQLWRMWYSNTLLMSAFVTEPMPALTARRTRWRFWSVDTGAWTGRASSCASDRAVCRLISTAVIWLNTHVTEAVIRERYVIGCRYLSHIIWSNKPKYNSHVIK